MRVRVGCEGECEGEGVECEGEEWGVKVRG